jgi:hypothetical protein
MRELDSMPRGGRESGPQGLKPASLAGLSGKAEAVPTPQSIYETSSIFPVFLCGLRGSRF